MSLDAANLHKMLATPIHEWPKNIMTVSPQVTSLMPTGRTAAFATLEADGVDEKR